MGHYDYDSDMSHFFIPYVGKKPAATSINGYKLLIVSQDSSVLEDRLSLLGADRVKKIRAGETKEEEEVVLSNVVGKIAQSVQAGIVVAPSELGVEDLIKNLEDQLPWIQ